METGTFGPTKFLKVGCFGPGVFMEKGCFGEGVFPVFSGVLAWALGSGAATTVLKSGQTILNSLLQGY